MISQNIKNILIELEEGVKGVFEEDAFKNYLRACGNFHDYSDANCMLIAAQKPDATLVAGYNAWKKLNRQVRRGEKGIRIICPCLREKQIEVDGVMKDIKTMFFKAGYVFDVSQTIGKDLPELRIDLLQGDVSNYDKLFEAISNSLPIPVFVEDLKKGANGCCDYKNKKISISSNMSELQMIKTLLHEAAHCILHASELEKDPKEKTDKAEHEIVAEGAAYAVSSWLGLDVSEYSFPYVAAWAAIRKNHELKDSLAKIKDTARVLINGIEANYETKGEEENVH